MSTGKEKCEALKRIRKDIADRYGLEYTPSECTHQGDCSGTCPRCDAELEELQRQLELRGITDIDLKTTIETFEDEDRYILPGYVRAPLDEDLITATMGLPAPPYTYKEKRRILYKECQVAGITFHDLTEVWDELYEGAELVLIRDKDNKHDKYAIAVALADDYDGNPDDFDFDYILGYVPRTENQYLATMMDLGWAEAFECELSQVNGNNPFKGSLYMKIYMVSKEEQEVQEEENLLRVLEIDEEINERISSDLYLRGSTYFTWPESPYSEDVLPNKGDRIVFMYKKKDIAVLYLMYCIASKGKDTFYFTKDVEPFTNRSSYVFTNIKGPIQIELDKLNFIDKKRINIYEPEVFLSHSEASELLELIDFYTN